jgi:hypothetical protein
MVEKSSVILFDVVFNGIVFLISFSDRSCGYCLGYIP